MTIHWCNHKCHHKSKSFHIKLMRSNNNAAAPDALMCRYQTMST